MPLVKISMMLALSVFSVSAAAHDSLEAVSQTHGPLSRYLWAFLHPWLEPLATPTGLLVLTLLNALLVLAIFRLHRVYAISAKR